MGFNLLKAIVNPFSMLPGKASKIGSIVSGNIIPGMMGSQASHRGGMPRPSDEAMNYLRSLPADDQRNIMAGFGGRPDIQGWYDNAVASGSIPGAGRTPVSHPNFPFQSVAQPPQGGSPSWQSGTPQSGVPMMSPGWQSGAPQQGGGPMLGGPLAGLMAGLTKLPIPGQAPPLDLNSEYERIKAEQGAGAAREWMKSQQG